MKRRINKYIEARKRQQGGIVKCQNKLISSNSMSGRKFYQSNPELVELYNEEIDRQENEWLNKYYSNQGKLMGINEDAEEGYLYGYVPNIIGFDKDKLQNQKPKQIAFDAYNGYALGNYSIPEYKDALYKSVDDGDIRKSKANRILKNLDRYYENEQDRLNDEAWRNAANRLADKVDVSALNTADRKDYEGLGYFGLGASLMPAILAAGYPLPAILDTGGTALGFLGSPLTTTVQSATNLVPSLAQYSWLQPSLFAGGIGTALTSCSSPEARKKEEEKGSQQYNDKGKDSYIFKRRYPNDGPTQKESEFYEDSTARRINSTRKLINHDYDIPYIDSLEITVPGVGRVSSNALDTMAKYAFITNTPLRTAIGLPAQESAFGAIPYYNYNNSNKITKEQRKERNRALGNSSYFRNYGFIPANYFVRDWEYFNLPSNIKDTLPPVMHALNYFNSGKYNPGDPNHTADVNGLGDSLMKTEEIQNWLKNSYWGQKAINIK